MDAVTWKMECRVGFWYKFNHGGLEVAVDKDEEEEKGGGNFV